MVKILGGYRIKTTNISRVEHILKTARNALHKAAIEEYHRMLAEDIAEIVDDVTLNIRQRPQGKILDAAIQLTNERISRAEATGNGTEYDLRVGVTIVPDRGYTYLMLSASNDVLVRAFANVPGIEDYTFSETDDRDVVTEKEAKWEELYKRYNGDTPMMNAALTTQLSVDIEKLVYPSKLERAQTRARRSLTSRILNQYACGQEIKSGQLMPLMDKALAMVCTPAMQEELEAMTAQLSTTLIDITNDIVMRDTTAAVSNDSEETE